MIFLKKWQKALIITISSLVLILAACLTAFLLTFEVQVNLVGDGTVETEAFAEFEDPGASGQITLPYIDFKCEIKLDITDNIDNSKLGRYQREYNASFLGRGVSISRNVEVVDTTPPEITAPESIPVDLKNQKLKDIKDIPFSFSAKDLLDGDVTDAVTKKYGKKGCTLTVIDKAGNRASYLVKFDFSDKAAPTLTIEADIPVYLEQGEEYTELGFTATDDVDGDITDKVIVTNIPDTSVPGTYYVTYEVTDSSYNTTTATQKVIVHQKWDGTEQEIKPDTQKTIYLTFDDGPGIYTQYLLNKLKEYDVKATFFVTDQFPKYRKLIKKAYEDGHSIGAHTYSHRFDVVYSSIENYLDDFEKIQSVIEKQTGQRTNIFRFPGGTSNTVSQKYAKGIMSALASEMTSRGYVYFDWNYDCGDTSGKTAKEIYNGVLNHVDTRFKTENSTIILLHDIKAETIKAIPKIIEYCLSKGYTFAGLEENSPNRQFAPNN